MPATKPLHPNGAFLVRQSRTVNIVMGSALLLVFLVSMVNSGFNLAGVLGGAAALIVLAFTFFGQGLKNRVVIRVDGTGFYQSETLVCTWDYFERAWLEEKAVVRSIQDNFVIRFQFYSEDRTKLYTRTIPMANTYDKADEEIIAAIDFYYRASLSPVTQGGEEVA
jgi:hypothetical protein